MPPVQELPPSTKGLPPYAGWIYWTASDGGAKPAKKAKDKLPVTARAGLDDIMTRFRFRREMPKEHKYLASGVHELRYRERNNEYRLLFAIWGNFLVALDAFYKNTEKTDFAQAAKRWSAWQARNGKQPPPQP